MTPTSSNRIYDFTDQILHVKIDKINEAKKVSKLNLKSNEKLLAIQTTQNNTSLNYSSHFRKNPNLIKKQISRVENQNSINSETPPSTQNGTDSDFLQDDNINTS